jgi:hypothetical protein
VGVGALGAAFSRPAGRDAPVGGASSWVSNTAIKGVAQPVLPATSLASIRGPAPAGHLTGHARPIRTPFAHTCDITGN